MYFSYHLYGSYSIYIDIIYYGLPISMLSHNRPTFTVPSTRRSQYEENTTSYNYLSNVAGKRSCFGEQLARQEIFLFLTSLLQNFYFKPPEGQDSIDVDEDWGAGLVNSPTDYKVRMIAREL